MEQDLKPGTHMRGHGSPPLHFPGNQIKGWVTSLDYAPHFSFLCLLVT